MIYLHDPGTSNPVIEISLLSRGTHNSIYEVVNHQHLEGTNYYHDPHERTEMICYLTNH